MEDLGKELEDDIQFKYKNTERIKQFGGFGEGVRCPVSLQKH